jgi:hypothetical protein
MNKSFENLKTKEYVKWIDMAKNVKGYGYYKDKELDEIARILFEKLNRYK